MTTPFLFGHLRWPLINRNRRPDQNPPKSGVIEIKESSALHVSENYLNPAGGSVVRWQELLTATIWTIGLFSSVQTEAGVTTGATIGVHVGGVGGMTPDGNFGSPEEQRHRQLKGWLPDPYPAKQYRASRSLNGPEVNGDLHDVLDWLLGQFVRNLGLPDLLYRPPT